MATAPTLPDRTSRTYCRPSQDGMRSGAARRNSVAWQEYRSSPGSTWSGVLRVASDSIASVQRGMGAGSGSLSGTLRSHASFQ